VGRWISIWAAVCRYLKQIHTQRFGDRYGPCLQAIREGRRVQVFEVNETFTLMAWVKVKFTLRTGHEDP
jgi:hypothetical protein